MNKNKINQDVVQIIAKLPSWVSAAVGIVSTAILAISLIQQNFVIAVLTLAVTLWLSCLYIWSKHTEPLVEGGTGVPAFPAWRRFALIGMVLIQLL